MRVYLDTADHSYIERLRRHDAKQFESFIQAWEESDASLVLSLAHAKEVASIDDEKLRAERLATLRELGPPLVTYNFSDDVAVREGQVYLALRNVTGMSLAKGVAMTLFRDSSASAFEETVEEYVSIMPKWREAENLAASAHNEMGPQKIWKFPKGVPPGASVERMIASVRDLAAGLGVPAEQAELMNAMANDLAKDVLEAGGIRPGLLKRNGIAAFAQVGRVPDSDISIVAGFVERVRERFGRPMTEQEAAEFLEIDFYSLPALALETAYNRALKASPITKEPGAETDRDHLVFAPYVDLLSVDKRTIGYIQQEARDRSALMPSGVPRSLIRTGNVAELQTLLLSRSNDR